MYHGTCILGGNKVIWIRKIRLPCDRLIFNMAISLPEKDGLYIATGPWFTLTQLSHKEYSVLKSILNLDCQTYPCIRYIRIHDKHGKNTSQCCFSVLSTHAHANTVIPINIHRYWYRYRCKILAVTVTLPLLWHIMQVLYISRVYTVCVYLCAKLKRGLWFIILMLEYLVSTRHVCKSCKRYSRSMKRTSESTRTQRFNFCLKVPAINSD